MSANLIDAANGLLTSDVISKMSALVGESPASTQRVMSAVIPSLAGVACNEASTATGASRLMSLISDTHLPGDLFGNLSRLLGGGSVTDGFMKTGSNLITGLLGDRAGKVVSLISNTTGAQFSSVSSLMNLGAPLLFGVLGRHITASGITTSSLSSLLSSHRETILQNIPPGLGSALGLNGDANLCGAAPAPAVRPIAVAEPRRGFPWWGWAVPLVALVAAFLGWRSCATPTVERAKLANITLPCGTVLAVEEGSFNFNLANFMLKGSDAELPKRFVFDHLNFDSATTQLTAESNRTVTDLIAILKCYPNMTIKLDGHTDNTGDPAANRKLSVDRAVAVKDLMATGGVDGSRIATEGFGQEKPIATNDSEDGRAKNRRTELVVTKMK